MIVSANKTIDVNKTDACSQHKNQKYSMDTPISSPGGSTFPSNLGDESDGAAVQGGTETYQVLIQSLEIMTGILSPVQHGLVVRGLRVSVRVQTKSKRKERRRRGGKEGRESNRRKEKGQNKITSKMMKS